MHAMTDVNNSCPRGNGRETTKHYLFECPLYNTERIVMLSDINVIGIPPNLNNLLYGCRDKSKALNFQLFDIVQKFIKDSERFA